MRCSFPVVSRYVTGRRRAEDGPNAGQAPERRLLGLWERGAGASGRSEPTAGPGRRATSGPPSLPVHDEDEGRPTTCPLDPETGQEYDPTMARGEALRARGPPCPCFPHHRLESSQEREMP